MAMPNDPRYHARASLEDMLALLCAAIDNQKTMRVLSFRGTGPEAMDAIFTEANQQGRALRRLAQTMQADWHEIQALIEG